MEYISNSQEETYKIAQKIAEKSKGGDIYLLSGDLGSGKTTFVKGFADFLDIKRPITSPTFVIMKQYQTDTAIKTLIHVDCYRLESGQDAEAIGLLEIFDKEDVITLIEWPEKIQEVLPKRSKKINFEYVDENKRKIIEEK